MSIPATKAVWHYSKQQKSGALVVLLAIADYANEHGIAWPSVPTLARKARMSKRNVQRWLKALEADGELQIFPNKGRHGSNLYKTCLPLVERNTGVTHDTTDTGGATCVTPVSSTNDAGVTQSINESSIQSTPVVPKGDDKDFWIKACFRCFEQPVHPIRAHVLRALSVAIPTLDKNLADSLIDFYQAEPLHSKQPPYSSRRHSPERLMRDLPRQLALAVQTCPPPEPEKKRNFTIHDVHEYLTATYPGCWLPRSLDELDSPMWHYMREEIENGIRERREDRNNSGCG